MDENAGKQDQDHGCEIGCQRTAVKSAKINSSDTKRLRWNIGAEPRERSLHFSSPPPRTGEPRQPGFLHVHESSKTEERPGLEKERAEVQNG